MSVESELKIREHCDSIRQQVDIARETAIENLHKASNKLMSEIDEYERERLSSWKATKESTDHVVEDVSKRMRAFLAEQHAFLQSVKASDIELLLLSSLFNEYLHYLLTSRIFKLLQASETELISHLDEANKLAQELSDRKMQLKAAMFNDKLASFIAFPSMDDVYLGELAFSTIKLPFKTLSITNTDLTPIDFLAQYDFVLPLEHGQRIVTFTSPDNEDATHISCFDRLGRRIGSDKLEGSIKRDHVALNGPKQFVVHHYSPSDLPELSVYNSSLHRLRSVECKNFSKICCNSKFVIGLWDTIYSHQSDSDDEQEEEEEYSTRRIQVRNWDTLSKAFCLVVPEKYEIEGIMADEQHVVAMSRAGSEWFMSVFDLAACTQSVNRGARKRAAGNFFLAEKHVLLDLGPHFYRDSEYLSKVFSFDGCLVVPRQRRELVWFDKNGTPSETRTELDSKNMRDFYASGSIIILTSNDGKLLLKR